MRRRFACILGSRVKLLHCLLLLLVTAQGLRDHQQQQQHTSSSSSSSPSMTPHTMDDSSNDNNNNALLVLCTADGRLYTVQAWTGTVQTDHVIHTAPLIGRSRNTLLGGRGGERTTSDNTAATAIEDDDDSLNMILPGLDGRLYWQQDDGNIESLPLEMTSLLEQPVQSCRDDDQTDCGILSATVETSLLAIHAKNGKKKWYDKDKGADTAENDDEDAFKLLLQRDDQDDKDPILLLQRRDYYVKHVQSTTGKQAWNISLGTWHALDFAPPQTDEEQLQQQELLPGHVDSPDNKIWKTTHLELPAIVFKNAGRTLIAVDLATMQVIWTIRTPSVVASVFGMQQGQWKAVQVLQEQDLRRHESSLPPLMAIDAQGANEAEESESELFLAYALQDWFGGSTTSPLRALHDRQMEQGLEQIHDPEQPDDSGSAKPRFPRRGGEEYSRVCMMGDDCRNIPGSIMIEPYQRQQLLPSPPPIPQQRWQPDGLWLSWKLVGGMLVGFLLVTGIAGHLWYMRKKRKWLEEMIRNNDLILSATDRKVAPKDTDNLLGNPADETKIDGKATNALDNVPLEEPVSITPIGNIPLVRYSRYATEFEEFESLGKGGFGSVWRVRNRFDGRHYAVKKVHIIGTADDPLFQQRLERTLREVKILAALDHPNIVRYYNAWLEVEKEHQQTDEAPTKDSTFDENSVGMSRYSSSMLTDSVSQWPSTQFNQQPRRRPLRGAYEQEVSEEPSLFGGGAWRPLVENGSDYLIFEESDITDKESKLDHHQQHQQQSAECSDVTEKPSTTDQDAPAEANKPPVESFRHILYIQMQLCAQKTIGDLLCNMSERQGNAASGVDIPQALKLFQQIAQAVHYVHTQGLIHRDLKPANCFVDESGNVQVGDFGLSRESSDRLNKKGAAFLRASSLDMAESIDTDNVDHTAGVGTRSYASPEQMNGSDYDSSTDIYSLAVLLFELVYPMYTGMERNICLARLRESQFPNDFDKLVGNAFPTLQALILSMLSIHPSDRPTASTIAAHIKTILSEYTIFSLDESQHQGPGMLLLRVEAEHCSDALSLTIDAIRQAATQLAETVDIIQYGLRSSSDGDRPTAIMEFALKFKDGDGSALVSELQQLGSIYNVRQVRLRAQSQQLSN